MSTGEDYTSNGPLSSGIAYLQTGMSLLVPKKFFHARSCSMLPPGPCDTNGESCTLVEMTLGNSDCEGCGSSADISLISPSVFSSRKFRPFSVRTVLTYRTHLHSIISSHAFNVGAGFSYFDGCDGTGTYCTYWGPILLARRKWSSHIIL